MKNLILLGGTSSLGNSVYKIFMQNGYKIYATYFSNNKNIEPLGNIKFHHLDLNDNSSIANFCEFLFKNNIKIDAMVSLAGNIGGKNLKGYCDNDIDLVFKVNFIGQVKLIKKILPLLTDQSRLIFLSSIAAQKGSFDPIYAASKGALLSFVKSVLRSLPAGSTINAIAPGPINNSTMTNAMNDEVKKIHLSAIHSREFLDINDLSKIIFDICQDHWRHLNGSCIDINGGEYLR